MINMDTLDKLKAANTSLEISAVDSARFSKYGRIVAGFSFEQFDSYMMDSSEFPETGDIYVASVPELEGVPVCSQVSNHVYGELPVQIGYCNGNNSMLNGLEYHKCSEVIYAVTDIVLLLGHIWDIKENKYYSENIEAFYLPQGCAVEVYATTLHFAPCKVDSSGFKSVIMLAKGTNYTLDEEYGIKSSEDELLFMTNKWLIVHPDATSLVDDKAYVGIVGENIEVMTI